MYLRFVVAKRGEESGSRLGALHAADELLHGGELEPYEEEVLRDALAWLDKHLPVPAGVQRPGLSRAISWFKDFAAQPIERMWAIAAILREHGVAIEVVQTANPGRVRYEDEWQAFAVPLRDRNASS